MMMPPRQLLTVTCLATLCFSISTSAESKVTEHVIALAKGHFIVEADESIERFQVTAIDIPGQCTPALSINETGDVVMIGSNDRKCSMDVVGRLRINPNWTRTLVIKMKAGQLDLKPSILEHLAKVDAKVKMGDIFGISGVKRSWLFGADLHWESNVVGMNLRASVDAGQISFVGTGTSP